MSRYSLSKSERISGKTAVAALLENGRGGVAGCLRYKALARAGGSEVSRILVSVPKRNFKRAVKRNLLKRRIREAYRLQKELLGPVGKDIMFIYVSREVLSFADIYASMTQVLEEISPRASLGRDDNIVISSDSPSVISSEVEKSPRG